ncbi:hypothetical protein [Sutcliffiella rhizosphaerae]|uniref:Uncharacterized protein n=1 Tax=Sutcliffiella rhizosphaerae TaxID=2880967 RepID=A0ABM8YPY9_9BACI|nr:hypothetical protein [Sutcliffiella rhizosphaerae]CAG9621993.1 hypothetical protein BACCIP111883_02784 [Sutcliffiella rhizosphaerae]
MKAFAQVKILLLFMLLGYFFYPSGASAAASLEVKVEYGVENKVQMSKGHTIRIEVANKGEDVKGDFVVFSNPTYNMAGSYVVPMELEAGGTKTIELAIKGSSDYYSYNNTGTSNNFVSFYEGGVEKGKEVKLSGNANSKPRFIGDNRVVLGVLSNKHDAVNYLKLYKFHNESMELLNVDSHHISTESYGLEMFDILLVHDFSLATLTENQQNAIKSWVKNGGSLVYDTKVGIGQDLGNLSDFLLMAPKTETTIKELNEDSRFPNIPIFTGELLQNDSNILTKDNDTPITLVNKVGTGYVTQITSNLSSPQWAEWSEGNKWWSSVLQKISSKSPNSYRQPIMEELSHQLTPVSEAFPGSIVSVPLLISAFIFYLIILIPVLYLALRKMDKREHSWWIIPSIAILTSITVFGVGAKDRISGTQVNEASVLLLDNEIGAASGYGSSTILTNSGGDYLVSTDKVASLFPITFGYNDNIDLKKHYAYINSGVVGTDITYKDVEYWSIRSSIGTINSASLGKIDYDIFVKDGKVQGTISNQLSYELTDVFILSGSNSHSLGIIKAGESVEVDYEIAKGNIANALTSPQMNAAAKAFPGFTSYNHYGPSGNKVEKEELDKFKKFQLLDLLMYKKDLLSISDHPVLVGYVSEDILGTKVNGKSVNPNAINLVVLPIEINNIGGGSFSFTEESMNKSISVAEGSNGSIHHNGLDFGEQYVYTSNGTFTLSYTLPDMIDLTKDDIQGIQLKLRSRNMEVEYFIYNHSTNELEPLDNKPTITLENKLKHYISEQGTIDLSLQVSNMDSDIQVPGIQVEGEIKE